MIDPAVDIPRVSVVIPSYNAEAFIDETLQSVIAQEYQNWEIIVVDDRSTDGTVDVVQGFIEKDPRITLSVLDANSGGPAKPRNVGVRLAKGDYVAFLDADDLWHREKLSTQMEVIRSSGLPFCSSAMKDFTDSGDLPVIECTGESSKVEYRRLCWRNSIPTSTVLADRSFLEKYPMNEAADMKAVEDYDCWLRVHKEIEVSVKCTDVLMHYRRQPDQISGSKLEMAKKVFRVHRRERKTSFGIALTRTACHILGGGYYRLLKRLM